MCTSRAQNDESIFYGPKQTERLRNLHPGAGLMLQFQTRSGILFAHPRFLC